MIGQTRKQMLDAVGGAIYIWPFERSLPYAIDLANALDRSDLKIFTLSDLDRKNAFRGADIHGVVVDHACIGRISSGQSQTLDLINARVRDTTP